MGSNGGREASAMNRCKQCDQPLVEIDNWGQRLTGCLTCNLWQADTGESCRLAPDDIVALRSLKAIKIEAGDEKQVDQDQAHAGWHGGVYKLLNSKGERVGTAYVEHAGPLSRWGWFAYVNGYTASNSCPLETSKQAYEELEEIVRGHGLSVRPAHAE
jgi:hypothetical protein